MALAKTWALGLGFAVAHKTPLRSGALAGALAGAMARALTKFGVSSSHPSESMVRENCTLLGDGFANGFCCAPPGWLDGALAAWATRAKNDADNGIATLAPSAAVE